MADYSLRDAWWLQPKGPDNPLPALQLGVQMSQYKSTMLLKQKELANDIARTEILRKESEAKMAIQTKLAEGNAEFASSVAGVTDWLDDEQWAGVMNTAARNPLVVGGKAYLGAQHMRESARTAKRLEEEARSRIDARTSKTDLDFLKEERMRLLADSEIDLEDARIRDIDQDIAFAERQQKVREDNVDLRKQELGQKGQRLSIRQQRMYDNELKALNSEETATLKNVTDAAESKRLRMGFNLRRRELTSKYYPSSDATTPAAPAPTATPDTNPKAAEIRESFRQGKITKEQAAQQLRELGFK